jgi:hypothetical protein
MNIQRQCARSVLLVRPARFGYNPQTAASNRFQRRARGTPGARARAELMRLCGALRGAGVAVCVTEDSTWPIKPDAVFPNNWVSWHADGTIVLYPMYARNRRAERREAIVRAAAAQSGFRCRRLLDLSGYERRGRYLEGTGSLVLDHLQRVAYACRSVRTDEALLREWARLLDYEPLVFDAADAGRPLYHTNVMLAIGTRWGVVCASAIAAADRGRVLARLRASGREVIQIDRAAMRAFAGNLLELDGAGAQPGAQAPVTRTVLLMSARARAALCTRAADWGRLRGCVDAVLAVAVPTIEQAGGGSVRCMVAEIAAVTDSVAVSA